jgi:hypothetical protein
LEIIAADSGGALLNNHFEPTYVVAATAIHVKPPYRTPSTVLAEPIFTAAQEGHALIIHELELCQMLLKKIKADVIHLDISFGGISVEELSPIQLSNMRVPKKTRSSTLKILPKIRKLSGDIKRLYGIDVIAIGKESVPVRIAELTSGAYAVLYTIEKALKEKIPFTLGLPAKCTFKGTKEVIMLQSLMPAEYDIIGYVKTSSEFLNNVEITEFPNPCARGFRALKIKPK